MGLWSIIEPEATTNLITNPSIEAGVAGFTAASSGVFAQSSEWQTSGLYSLKVTPNAASGSGVYYSQALTADTQYTFSLDFKGKAGISYNITVIRADGSTVVATLPITGDDKGHRYQLTFTAPATETYRLYIRKGASASTDPFYIDRLQVEAKAYPTTYCDGDQDGCTWSAGAHSSTSSRVSSTFTGGKVTPLDDTRFGFIVKDTIGVGMAPVELITTLPAQSDGGDYQRAITRPRPFQLVGYIGGNDRTDYHEQRNALIRALNPKRLPTESPVRVLYTLNGKSVYIDAYFIGGLEKGTQKGHGEIPGLRFIALQDPYFKDLTGLTSGAYTRGIQTIPIVSAVSLADVNYLIQRAANGQWATLGSTVTLPTPGGPDDGAIWGSAIDLDGSIYLGGSFSAVNGDSNIHLLAKWDGVQWSKVGTSGPYTAIGGDGVEVVFVGSDGTVYIGGEFSNCDSVANTLRLAKWTGTAWQSVQGATAPPHSLGDVYSICQDNSGNLYLSGLDSYVRKWTGAAWTEYGPTTTGYVYKIVIDKVNNVLYCAGPFTGLGGIANTNGLAKINLSNGAISSIATGSPTLTEAAGFYPEITWDADNQLLYVVGNFSNLNGQALASAAVYNPSNGTWSALGTGLNGRPYGAAISNGELYVSGNFTQAGGVAVSYVAKWNRTQWIALGAGFTGGMGLHSISVAPDQSRLLFTGTFTQAGSETVKKVAFWTGSDWKSIASATRALLQGRDGSIYVGGGFSQLGGIANTSRIARWFNNAWNALGTGANGEVYAIAEGPDGSIYIGGNFTSVGGVANTKGIAKWDGVQWLALGTGIVGTVLELKFSPSGTLYIGGLFTSAGGVANTKNVATWNGSAFAALGTGANSVVTTITFDPSGNPYFGGAFTTFNGQTIRKLCKSVGGTYSQVGSTLDGTVLDMLFLPTGELVLTGTFKSDGSTTLNYISKWTGTAHMPLGSGLNKHGGCLAYDPTTDKVYVGGGFDTAGGLALPDHAAVWIGSAWAPLSVNLPGSAFVWDIIITNGGQIVIAFDSAGTASVSGIN